MNRVSPRRPSRVHFAAVVAFALLAWTGPAAGAAGPQEPGDIVGRVFLDENADTTFAECDCDCGMENIPVRLYRNHCGGLIVQTARTDAEGFYRFAALEPGTYCLMPRPKFICEGYQPTKSITQTVEVKPGETTEVEWFGFDHFLEVEN